MIKLFQLVTGRGPGDSNKSLKPVLDNLVVQFNNLKTQITELQAAVEEIEGDNGGLQTDFQGENVTLNANGTGGTFQTNGGRIEFDSLGGGFPGYIQTGSASPYGGIGFICMVGHECNWQDGVLSLNGPRHAGTGTLKLGDIEIGRDYNDGPELLIINNCTLKITNLPVFPDNATALAGGLSEHALYTTSSGELRVVRD